MQTGAKAIKRAVLHLRISNWIRRVVYITLTSLIEL